MNKELILLDTNAIIYFLSTNPKHKVLSLEIGEIIHGKTLFGCPITEGESLDIVYSRKLGHRRLNVLYNFLNSLNYLDITSETAAFYARQDWAGRGTMNQNDKWLASLIVQYSIMLLTLDTDFTRYDFLEDYIIFIDLNEFIS